MPRTPPDSDAERMERVLDAAADLLVRWGYRRVTVDAVAQQAHVGKGTVYLHVRSKDALLLTVLLRAQRRLFGDLADRILADPEIALPWRMTRLLHDRMQADEVSRAVYLGDVEVLGRIAHEAAGSLGELAVLRAAAVGEHLDLLRDAGLVTTDLSAPDQAHSWGAVAYGFFAISAIPSADLHTSPTERGRLVEHAVRALLAVPGRSQAPPPPVAARIADLYRPLVAHIDQEWRRRVR